MTETPMWRPVVETEGPIRVLIAEDEAHLGTMLEQFMTARGFSVRIARDGRSALELLRTEPFDVALLDVAMPEIDGLEVLRQLREEPRPPEVIVITGNGTIETALAALELGAYDFLSKPYRMAEIDALVRRAWEKRVLVRGYQHLRARLDRHDVVPSFLTQYAPLAAVLSMVSKFAPSPMPVVLTGEVGTGKALVARLLHRHGARPAGPFIEFDCAAVDPERQVVEMAGLDRGNDLSGEHQHGIFELAQGGTLHLQHIEVLAPAAQTLLLAALDQLVFTCRGGRQRLPFDVRVVVSGERDLTPSIESGAFSETLWHRLSAMRVALPPLRDRIVDIPLLAGHLLGLATPPGHRPLLRLSNEAVEALERYHWPGNVRELQLVLERAALIADHGVVEVSHLTLPSVPAVGRTAARANAARVDDTRGGSTFVSRPRDDAGPAGMPPASPVEAPSLGDLERRHIAEVLERTGWHQGRAADLLGISPKTLYRKIREYGFKRPSGRNT